MKHTTLNSIIAVVGLSAGTVLAGESPSKNPAPKNPPIVVEDVCACFDPGQVTVSLYGAGIIFDNSGVDDDSLGGGLGVAYFFSDFVGVEADATWLATDSVLHNFSGSLVLRYPIKSACLAPYIFGGGGYEVDGIQQWTTHVGGGIDIRLGGGDHCPGLFADARYTWTEEESDFTLVRAGFKFNL